MLLGRTAYVLSPNIPYYCGNIHSLKNIEEKSSDIKLLNYMVFAYFAPWELMFDCDYIRWRLKNPKIIDVYRKNLSFVLNKIEIDYSTMLQMNTKERFGMILKMKHNLSDSMIAIYMTKQKEFSYSEMCQIFEMEMENSREKIKDMERIMNNLDQELDLIRNSTSWKVTKPLRNIGQIIRNYRR